MTKMLQSKRVSDKKKLEKILHLAMTWPKLLHQVGLILRAKRARAAQTKRIEKGKAARRATKQHNRNLAAVA